MKKIPTLFKRDDKGRVTPEPNGSVAQRILDDPTYGIATRKYDGTAILVDDDGQVWKRYTLKPGKVTPPTFNPTGEPDPTTRKQPGWVKAYLDASSEKHLQEAIGAEPGGVDAGTHELCGPKINGNPEGIEDHRLIPHGCFVLKDVPRSFDELREYLAKMPIEGIVWWSLGEPVAKLKTKDFGIPRYVAG